MTNKPDCDKIESSKEKEREDSKMYKVTYTDGRDNNKRKEKFFKTLTEANGFQIVSWHEYQCFKFKIEKIKDE